MSALAENPEDQFSHNEAHNYILDNVIKPELVRYKVAHVNEAEQVSSCTIDQGMIYRTM